MKSFCPMLMKTGILYFMACFQGFGILRHVDPFVRMLHIYCVEVWGNACDTHPDPIIKIKKKCVRVITFSHYLEPTESLFKDLKILAFKKLVIRRILLLMFKHNIGIVPNLWPHYLQKK